MSVELPAFPGSVEYLGDGRARLGSFYSSVSEINFLESQSRAYAWEARARFLIAAMIQAPKEATREHCEETLAEAISAVGELPPEAGT